MLLIVLIAILITAAIIFSVGGLSFFIFNKLLDWFGFFGYYLWLGLLLFILYVSFAVI